MSETTAQVDGCPCGTSGVDCTILVSPLANLSGALSELCDPKGFANCLVSKEEATCECRCGVEGEFCQDVIKAETYNFILGFIFVFTVVGDFISYLRKKEKDLKSNGLQDYGMKKTDFVTSDIKWVSPTMILIYRIAMLVVFFPTIIAIFADDYKQIKFFTNWAFLLFGLTFMIGAGLSARFVMYGDSKSEELGIWEKSFLILFEMEIPAAFILSVVVWTIIYPTTAEEDLERDVFNPKLYVVHGSNVILLLIEFYFNKLYFVFHHIGFLMLLIPFYSGFHLIVQVVYTALGEPHCPFYGFLDMAGPIYVPFQLGLLLMFGGGFWLFYKLSEKKKTRRSLQNEESLEKIDTTKI